MGVLHCQNLAAGYSVRLGRALHVHIVAIAVHLQAFYNLLADVFDRLQSYYSIITLRALAISSKHCSCLTLRLSPVSTFCGSSSLIAAALVDDAMASAVLRSTTCCAVALTTLCSP
jgi:hypothetical protein